MLSPCSQHMSTLPTRLPLGGRRGQPLVLLSRACFGGMWEGLLEGDGVLAVVKFEPRSLIFAVLGVRADLRVGCQL
jgi:hypothetical protein